MNGPDVHLGGRGVAATGVGETPPDAVAVARGQWYPERTVWLTGAGTSDGSVVPRQVP